MYTGSGRRLERCPPGPIRFGGLRWASLSGATMRKNRRKYKPSSIPVPNQARIVTRKLSHRRIIDVTKTWYVVKTAGGHSERRAEFGIRSAGFDVYRPHEDRWRIYRRRCSDVSIG